LVVTLLAAGPARATFYHWTGAVDTDYFNAGNWSKGSDPDPYPRTGDSARFGNQAGNYPSRWCHFNGVNNTNGAPDGNFLMGGATNAWFFMESGLFVQNNEVKVAQSKLFNCSFIQTGGTFDCYTANKAFGVGTGSGDGCNGDITVSGGSFNAGDFAIGRNGDTTSVSPATASTNRWGLFSGTAQVHTRVFFLGMGGTNSVCTNRDDATLLVDGRIEIGGLKSNPSDGTSGGTGKFYQEGGTVTCSYLNLSNTLDTLYMLSGGRLNLDYIADQPGGTFIFDGGTLVARGGSEQLIRRIGSVQISSGKTAYITNAVYAEVQSGITGDGGLTKQGAGILRLEGTNTFTGSTLVSAGTLQFGANQFLNNVTVSDDAGIGADMNKDGLPDNQAQLATLTMGSNSRFDFTLAPTEANPVPARIVLTNGLVLNGPVTVNPTLAQVPPPNTLFNLIDYGTVGISGSGSISLGALPCGMQANLATNGSVIGLYVTRGADVPNISANPASQTVLQNRPVSMSITLAECAEIASYQWVQNATNYIAGATNATYAIQYAQLSDAGSYTVVVTNATGAVTSSPPAVLTVIADTVPPVPLSAARLINPPSSVRIIFDELLDQASAETAGNYNLTNLTAMVDVGAPLSATLAADLKTVILSFSSALADNTRYAVVVAGVKDLALSTQAGAAVPVTLLGVLQPSGTDRIVVIEAEDANIFTASSAYDGNLRNWEIVSDRLGYSGWAAIRCLPNLGHTGNPTYQGPAATFNVNFPVTDTYPMTYYLWVRGAGTNSSDDSCHATLAWSPPLAPAVNNIAQNMYQPNTSGWGWTSMQGPATSRATLSVPSAGVHTVDLLMREDGFYCDKLVLTTSSTYDPSALNGGLGPDNVTRTVFPPTIAFVPGTLLYSGSAFTVDLQTAAGFTNIVEYKDSLATGSWTELTNFVGDGSVVQVQDSSPSASGRFYQARVVIP
jgi:autotransporter-associated beta strand protein